MLFTFLIKLSKTLIFDPKTSINYPGENKRTEYSLFIEYFAGAHLWISGLH